MAGGFTFDGVDISTYGAILQSNPDHPLMGDLEVDATTIPGAEGGYLSPSMVKPKEFNLVLSVVGTSHSDLLSKFDSLANLFAPWKGEKQLIFDAQTTRYWMAKLRGKSSREWKGPILSLLTLPMTASRPAYETSVTNQVVTIVASPHNFLIPASGVLGGTAHAWPKYSLTGATYTGQIVLTNLTTNEIARWTGTLVVTDVLDFICEDGNERYVIKKNGAISMAVGTSGTIPRLRPGIANSMSISGPTAGTLTITYRKRYL